MSIANVSSGESIEVPANPTELEELLESNWVRQPVPGLSHQPLQYVHTGNVRFSMELHFDAVAPGTGLDQVLHARRFVQSLCYPRRGVAEVLGGGPPRVLFVWPRLVSLTCVITALTFRYQRFNLDGLPVQFTARITLEEIRDVRLASEDVLISGTQRSGVGSEST
jgi:hypothetical protein